MNPYPYIVISLYSCNVINLTNKYVMQISSCSGPSTKPSIHFTFFLFINWKWEIAVSYMIFCECQYSFDQIFWLHLGLIWFDMFYELGNECSTAFGKLFYPQSRGDLINQICHSFLIKNNVWENIHDVYVYNMWHNKSITHSNIIFKFFNFILNFSSLYQRI